MFRPNSLEASRRSARPLSATVAYTLSAAAALSATFCFLTPATAHTRYHWRTASRSSLNRSQRALMSRSGGYDAPAATQITGQVGVVTTDNAPIYAGREQYGQLLFRVPKDQQVVVAGQTDQYYAVVMSNHSTGFISKSDVQLLDLKLTTSGATDASGNVAAAQRMPALVQALLQSAYNYKGVTPYLWGGNTVDGIDCSGFVKAVYSENGITLPRTAAEQATVGYAVPLRDLTQWAPGDRMYFQCHHKYIDHTGMYVGNGYFIHSSINHHGVDIDRVDTPYYWDHLVAVRRSTEVVSALQAGAQQPVDAPDFESSQE